MVIASSYLAAHFVYTCKF